MNKAMIQGNLGATPELRYTTGGQAVCDLRVATDESYSSPKTGARVKKTEWHSVVVWGKQAVNCCKYLTKGRQITVEGRLRTRTFTGRDDVQRQKTEIVADVVHFGPAPRPAAAPATEAPVPEVSTDEEIPF